MAFPLLHQLEQLLGESAIPKEVADSLISAGATDVMNALGWPADFATAQAVPVGGVTIKGLRISQVISDLGLPARRVPANHPVAHSTSLFRATSLSPLFQIGAGTLKIYPNGGTAYVYSPYVVDSMADVIPGFPHEGEHLAVIYAGVLYLWRALRSAEPVIVPFTPTDLDDAITALKALTVSAYVPPVLATTAALVISDFDGLTGVVFPTYASPSYTPATPPTIPSLTISATPPTVPVAWLDVTGGDATKPALPVLTAIVATTLGAVSDPVSFGAVSISLPSAPVIPALDATKLPDGLTTIELPPAAPTPPTLSFTPASPSTVATVSYPAHGVAPTYTKPTLTLPTPPSITSPDLTKMLDEVTAITVPSAAPTAPSLTWGGITPPTLTVPVAPVLTIAPTFTTPGAISISKTDFDARMTDEDVELAMAAAQELNVQVAEYRAKLDHAQTDFNSLLATWIRKTDNELAKFQADVSGAIEQARIDADAETRNSLDALQGESQEYVNQVQGWIASVQTYQTNVNLKIEKFNAELRRDLPLYDSEGQQVLQEYSLAIQNELNEYNGEMAVWIEGIKRQVAQFEADVQKAQTDARLATEVAISNSTGGLQSQASAYASEVQGYLGSVTAYRDQVNATIEDWKAEVDADLREWEIATRAALEQYAQDIQKELARVNTSIATYEAKVRQAQAQAEITANENRQNKVSADENLVRDADRGLQIAVTNADRTRMVEEANVRAELDHFLAELNRYREQVNTTVSAYVAEHVQGALGLYDAESRAVVSAYSADVQEAVGAFNSELAAVQAEFEDKLAQYAKNAEVDTNVWMGAVRDQVDRYRASVEAEASRVSLAVQEFQAKIQLHSSIFTNRLGQWQNKIQESRTETELYSTKAQAYSGMIAALLQQYERGLTRLFMGQPYIPSGQNGN